MITTNDKTTTTAEMFGGIKAKAVPKLKVAGLFAGAAVITTVLMGASCVMNAVASDIGHDILDLF